MIFKDAVALLPHSSFRILPHRITYDSILNSSNSTDWQGSSNHILKIFLVTLSIANNDINATALGKAVNALIKVKPCIEADARKVKISPWKNKQHNLEVLNYIKGVKYPEAEVGKYVYSIREVKYR